MVHVKVAFVFIFILLSVILQLRVESQPTINSFKDNTCPLLEEEENQSLKFELEYERQRLKTMENVSHYQSAEIQRLNVELENERQRSKTLKNVSYSPSEEIQRLNVELENDRQRSKTMENVSYSQSEEIQLLEMELENERRLVQRYLQRPAMVKLIKRIEVLHLDLNSVIKVRDEIYVLCHSPNSFNSIKVFEDRNEFRLLREIDLNGTTRPYDMVYSNESNCFYIRDAEEDCIWRMTTGSGHRLTKWLTNVTWPNTLSLSNEDHLLVLRTGQDANQLEIYSLSANLIRSIQLPNDVKDPRNVVQTSAGYYVIVHKKGNTSDGSSVISQVNSVGQLMNRFNPINQFQVLRKPLKLFYDSNNNRLFVPDYKNYRLILFDSNSLNWIQVLLNKETERIWYPLSVFYDAIKRQLLLLGDAGLDIYELI